VIHGRSLIYGPRLAEDVGSLRATDGVKVYEKCDQCRREVIVDLDALIEKFGPRYSLCNRTPPCPTPGCEGGSGIEPSRGTTSTRSSTKPRPRSSLAFERWKASLPDDVRDEFPVIPMLESTDQVLKAGCGPCDILFYISSLTAGAWGNQISLSGLTKRLATCRPGCELVCDMCPRRDVPPGQDVK
jgi:hypothetical protein